MRLRSLKLIRYGHFTDFTLNFGKHKHNRSDFHIIFGENEAGKSTAIDGFFNLLFGIHNQSKYGFQHSYDNLRIGAILELHDKTVELSRVKGRKDTLRDENDNPIPEDTLTSALYGLSSSSYPTMFCLNEETLEMGGEEILASKGHVGHMLFSGTSGLSESTKILENLQVQADQVYREGRHQDDISTLKQELKELDAERKRVDVFATTYKQLANTHQKAEEAYQQARKKRDDIDKNHSNYKSLKNAFHIRQAILKLEKDLQDIADLPVLPAGWREELIRLQQEKNTTLKTQEEAQNNLKKDKNKLNFLEIDPIIKMQNDIKNIENLKTRCEAAEEELPQLRIDLSDIENDLDEIRQKLGIDKTRDLEEFIIPEDTIRHLEELLNEEVSLKARSRSAEEELTRAQDNLQEVLNKIENCPKPSDNILEVKAVFENYINKEEDPLQRVNNVRKMISQKNRDLAEEIKNLAPWKGSTEEIADLDFPSIDQAENWSKKSKEHEERLRNLKLDQNRLKQDHAAFSAKLKSLSAYNTEISDVSAKKCRIEREKAWAEHRKKLDTSSADTFEKALADDDNIRDKRLAAVDQLARLRSTEEQLTETESRLEVIAAEILELENELCLLRNEIQPVLAKANLPNNFDAHSLIEWLKGLQRLRKLLIEKDEWNNDITQAEDEINQQRTVLYKALLKYKAELSETYGLEELRAIAKIFIEESNEVGKKHDTAKEALLMAENELRIREKNVKALSIQLKKWDEKWNKELEKIWFKEKKTCQVRALLEHYKPLSSKLTNRKKVSQRIREKETAKNNFFTSVASLSSSMGLEDSNNKIEQFLDLQKKLNEALTTKEKRNSIEISLEQSEKQLEKAERELNRIEKRVQEMAGYFSISNEAASLDHLSCILQDAQKKSDIIISISEKEAGLFETLGVKNRSDAEEKFGDITFEDIEKRLSDIERDLNEAEQELEHRIGDRRDALRELEKIGGDAVVARLEEQRQSVLLEISKKFNHSLALHLGLMAAKNALNTYRDRHRSDLLLQTADAFKSITGGAFSSLTTQNDQTGDRLIAVRRNGRSIAADEMSKGTRYQLYLALRLAAYRQFCNNSRSLPFIGDDIMETFDDHRSESAMHQLSELAKHGQVLYFTHHQHLCDIAKKVCGDGVAIHEIPKQV